jgi:hypothetical protein
MARIVEGTYVLKYHAHVLAELLINPKFLTCLVSAQLSQAA